MNSKRRSYLLTLAATFFCSASLSLASDQVVTDFGDNGGANQLRAKLAAAQSGGGGTLTFTGGPATITLTSALPAITSTVTIDGGGQITLSGSSGQRFFVINSGASLTLDNLVLHQGYFNGQGGAILNSGSLALHGVTIENSYAPGGGGGIATTSPVDIANCTFASNISNDGAAIYASGPMATLTISGSSFHDNSVSDNDTNLARGAAICLLSDAKATISSTEFYNNSARYGGAIAVVGSSSAVSLLNSSVHDNTASYFGGGIYSSTGTVICTTSTIAANSAPTTGGGVANFGGTLTATDSTFSKNSGVQGGYGGGGIENNGSTSVVNLTNVTLSGNTHGGGGAGMENAFGATAICTNVTFSGNIAGNEGGEGGGFYNFKSTATFTNVTFSGNSATTGGAIGNVNDPANHLYLRNVILSGSLAGGNASFEKTPDTNDANLSDDNTASFGSGHDNVGINLGPLASNGGPTQTHALLVGSPAINAGDAALASTRDQRHYIRAGAPDIGAFEYAGTIPATLGNISTRSLVETNDNVLIGGFIVAGTHNKQAVIRAIGPSLGVAGALANPTLQLYDGSNNLLAANDDWRTNSNASDIANTGIAPTNDLESALLVTLAPGAYTAIVRGANNTTGIGLVEAYDLDRTLDSKLANISTRALVQTGDNVLIGGLIEIGSDPQKVIIRALGPSLSVPGALSDPTLELHDGNGVLLEANDNWMDSADKQAIIDSTIPPTNNLESAIVYTLNPGNYTAIVRGANNSTGIALVEIYALN